LYFDSEKQNSGLMESSTSMFDVGVRVHRVICLLVIPSCKKKKLDVTLSTTQICSRERCAGFLLGGDFMITDQDGGKANGGPEF